MDTPVATTRAWETTCAPTRTLQKVTIDVNGANMAKSRKFRNLATNNVVALVVDDIVSHDPWRVRCLEIRGTAEQAAAPGGEAIIRIDTATDPHQLVPDSRDVPTAAS